MKTTIICLFLILLNSSRFYSQQETQHSLYFFNPMLFNPAYCGSQEALVVTAKVRNQWVNFKGAPKTSSISMHTPLRNDHVGIGFDFIDDRIGATKNTGFYTNFAYRILLNKKGHRLVFGIKSGVDYYQTNFSNLIVIDNTDDIYKDGYKYSKAMFNAGAGIYYYGNRFYLGASSPRLIKNKMNIASGQISTTENHYYQFGGCVFKLNSSISVRPSYLLKYTSNAPLSAEINMSFLFYEKIWLGALYRHKAAAGANIMYIINDNFKIGYAFDYTLNSIQNYSYGSHEIMLNFDLRSKSKGFKSPRFF